MRLKDKTAVVTGAAQGIGRAIAEQFTAEGARVIVTDINDPLGQSVASGLADGRYVHLDVRDETQWQSIRAMIEADYGHLDILVNNAGIAGFLHTKGPHDPEHLDLDSWREVCAVNSEGTALGCKYAIQLMKARGEGSIINISSRSGNVGIPWMSAYAASKAAVRNHTKSVALYCAEQGYRIRCNSIHPGAILTPIWDPMLGDGEQRERSLRGIAAQIPLKRMGSAQEVAWGAVYLAADESRYVTGIELHIDGGIMAGSMAAPADEEHL